MEKSSHHVKYNSLMARQNQPIAGNGRGASDNLVSTASYILEKSSALAKCREALLSCVADSTMLRCPGWYPLIQGFLRCLCGASQDTRVIALDAGGSSNG